MMTNNTPLTSPSWLRRMASLSYELLLLAAILFTTSAILTALLFIIDNGVFKQSLFALAFFSISTFYFGINWIRTGQTLPMKAWKIKLIRVDGSIMNWATVIIRSLIVCVLFLGLPAIAYWVLRQRFEPSINLMQISMLWCLVPLLSSWIDKDGQFLHDRMAGTRQILVSDKVDK